MNNEDWHSKCQLYISFWVVIWPLSSNLMKPNLCVSLSHWCSTIVSLETIEINRNEQSCYGDEAGAFESVESSGGIVVRVLASHQCVPGLIPWPSGICGLSLLLVLFLASRGFPPGTPVFPSPQNQHFPIPIQSGLLSALCHEPLAHVFAQALPVFNVKFAYTHL